jgi:hypothetical protein
MQIAIGLDQYIRHSMYLQNTGNSTFIQLIGDRQYDRGLSAASLTKAAISEDAISPSPRPAMQGIWP